MLWGKGTWFSGAFKPRTLAGQVEEQEFTKDPEQEMRKRAPEGHKPQKVRVEGHSKGPNAAETLSKMTENCSWGKTQTA